MRICKFICMTLLVSQACAIQVKPKRLRESLVQARQWTDSIVDGCLTPFYYTDKFASTDKYVGSFFNPEECLAAAIEQCQEYDLANLIIDGLQPGTYSACYCQKSGGDDLASFNGTSTAWATCQMRGDHTATTDNTTDCNCNCSQPSNETITLNETEQMADACETEWYPTNYFAAGEINIGSQPNKGECTRQALIQCPDYDLANVPETCIHGGECASCLCQKSGGAIVSQHVENGSFWHTCRVRSQNDTVPEVTPQPDEPAPVVSNQTGCLGDWVKTNFFGQGERNIGAVADQVECVEKAKVECPEYDLVNLHTNCLKSHYCDQCWCQHSNNRTVSEHPQPDQSYYTCRMKW